MSNVAKWCIGIFVGYCVICTIIDYKTSASKE